MKKIWKWKDAFPLIGLYRDWVAHTCLDGSSAQSHLKKIEDIFIKKREIDILENIYPFINFEELKKELTGFLKDYNLPKEVLKKENWYCFLDDLTNVLADSPLRLKDKNSKIIEEFIFKPLRDKKFITVEIKLKNGGNFSGMTNLPHVL